MKEFFRKAWFSIVKYGHHLDKPAKIGLLIPGIRLYAGIAMAVDGLLDNEWSRLQKEKAKEKLERAKSK